MNETPGLQLNHAYCNSSDNTDNSGIKTTLKIHILKLNINMNLPFTQTIIKTINLIEIQMNETEVN